MEVSHAARSVSASFDDPDLVSAAGLFPITRLAERAGLRALAQKRLTVPIDRDTNAGAKITSLVGGTAPSSDDSVGWWFHAALQKNVLNRHRWSTKQHLRLAIVLWIEESYHRKRRQRRLGRLTPIEFEIMVQPAALAA